MPLHTDSSARCSNNRACSRLVSVVFDSDPTQIAMHILELVVQRQLCPFRYGFAAHEQSHARPTIYDPFLGSAVGSARVVDEPADRAFDGGIDHKVVAQCNAVLMLCRVSMRWVQDQCGSRQD